MSAASITMVVWRILLNVNGNTNMNEFLPIFQEKLEREGMDGALRYCRARTDIIPRRLFVAGLETSKQGIAAMRRSMANVIELEILPDLNFLLSPILAVAKIATMVGPHAPARRGALPRRGMVPERPRARGHVDAPGGVRELVWSGAHPSSRA
jgi:hypothetical protein